MQRRQLILGIVLAAGLLLSIAARADDYPARPIRIVVPYGTGGGSDVLARNLAAGLQKLWSAGVVVENKPGASGNIGSQEVAHAASDGYTLLLQNSTMLTNLGVYGKLPYDPERDLTPIMLLGVTPIALAAHPSTKLTSLKDLIAADKAKPDTLTYGSCGIGTPQHFAMELVKQKTGARIAHAGYKGCAPAVQDVLAGQIPLAIVSANLVAPYAKNGSLNVLGVSTSKRYSLLPDTPTFEEQGIKPFDFSIWYALMGPAHLPAAVIEKITIGVQKVLDDPAVQANLSSAGVELYKGSAQDLARLIKADAVRYVDLAKSANIKAE